MAGRIVPPKHLSEDGILVLFDVRDRRGIEAVFAHIAAFRERMLPPERLAEGRFASVIRPGVGEVGRR